jgi:hypothetical protein
MFGRLRQHAETIWQKESARLLDWQDALFRADWPSEPSPPRAPERARVGVVIASYNTCAILSECLFSLLRVLADPRVVRIVVVDNASTDASPNLLSALQEAGLIQALFNSRQRSHGPALNQGVEWLRRKQLEEGPGEGLDWIWMLDSDALVLRSDVLDHVLPRMIAAKAGLAGEYLPREMTPEIDGYAHPCSLMIRPAEVWRRPIAPFGRSGAPAMCMQQRLDKLGWPRMNFPFMSAGYVLHLGGRTLQAVWRDRERHHPLFAWATQVNQPHYHGHPQGPRLWQAFQNAMQRELGGQDPEDLVRALAGKTRVELKGPEE